MTANNGNGPKWLRGPSIARPLSVFFVGFGLMLLSALIVSEMSENFAGKLSMLGWIIAAIAIIDFYISLFTILANRRGRALLVPQRPIEHPTEVPRKGYLVGTRLFRSKKDAEDFIYHRNVEHDLLNDVAASGPKDD